MRIRHSRRQHTDARPCVTRTPLAWTSAARSSGRVCPRTATPSRCGRSGPLPRTSSRWPSGWPPARSRPWRWNRPGCIGSLSTRFSRREDSGCHLVNARHLKHVPGRKSDVKDGQWIQYLHTCGLLSGSFRPAAEMCAMRAYLRHRATLLDIAPPISSTCRKPCSRCMCQLTQVLTDMTGTTGLAIIRAIVGGERDPVQLARFRHRHCASSTEEIAKALTGHDQPEHVFALRQALALYDVYTAQLRECDAEIERRFQAIKPAWPDELPPLDRPNKRASHSKNAPAYDAQHMAVSADGRGFDRHPRPACEHRANDPLGNRSGLRKWPNEKAFCAWLGLAPRHEISGGKVLRRTRSRPAIGPAKPSGWRPKRPDAATIAWGPSIGACGPASVPHRLS